MPCLSKYIKSFRIVSVETAKVFASSPTFILPLEIISSAILFLRSAVILTCISPLFYIYFIILKRTCQKFLEKLKIAIKNN